MNPYASIARPQAAALRSVMRGLPNNIHPKQIAIVAKVCTLIRRQRDSQSQEAKRKPGNEEEHRRLVASNYNHPGSGTALLRGEEFPSCLARSDGVRHVCDESLDLDLASGRSDSKNKMKSVAQESALEQPVSRRCRVSSW
eukprot:COSAG02_NODE_6122_length_3784_cov_38.086024_1_plen_141_part_00